MAKSHFSWSWRGSHFEVPFRDPSRTRFLSILVDFWGPFGHPLEPLFRHFFRPRKKLQKRAQHEPVLASEREAREFNEVLSTFAYLSQQSEELPDPPPHWEMEYIWFPTQPPTGKLNTFDFPPTPHWEMEYI